MSAEKNSSIFLRLMEAIVYIYPSSLCCRAEFLCRPKQILLFLSMHFCLYGLIIRIALWAGKMNQILRCDWLPERARWCCLARLGLPALSREKSLLFPYNKCFIDQACSVKMAEYWPRSFLCVFMDLDSVSLHKHAWKELGQYPAILPSRLVNNPYILPSSQELASYQCVMGSTPVMNKTGIFFSEKLLSQAG